VQGGKPLQGCEERTDHFWLLLNVLRTGPRSESPAVRPLKYCGSMVGPGPSGSRGGGERWSESGCDLKDKPTRLLVCAVGGTRGVKSDSSLRCPEELQG
jgi:hypothetical protein